MIEREELHRLLDMMLDEEKEVGNLSHMDALDYGAKITDIRLVLRRNEYEFPYPSPDILNAPPDPQGINKMENILKL